MVETSPVIEIRPPARGLQHPLRELWQHRTLVGFFVWRDLKVRYRQTLVGATWAILQPLVLMVVFTVFLSGIIEVPGGEVSYAVFVFLGLVPWTLFSQSVSQSANSVVNHQDLVRKAAFPRLVLPVAAVGPYLVNFAVATVVAIVAVVIATGRLSVTVLVIPLVGLLALTASLAIGIGLSALNVRYRDVKYGTPFLLQAWLFATPVVYPPDLAPEALRGLLYLNPMTGVVGAYRWAMLGTDPPSLVALVLSIGSSLVLLAAAVAFFSRSEETFADTI